MPGFLVFFVAHGTTFGWDRGGRERDGAASVDFGEGDDVPSVFGDDVGGDEVEDVADVGAMATADGAGVSVVVFVVLHFVSGGFDLHAGEAAFVSGDEVVVGHFSPGFADLESVFGRGDQKTHLGPFAARFLVGDDGGWFLLLVFHDEVGIKRNRDLSGRELLLAFPIGYGWLMKWQGTEGALRRAVFERRHASHKPSSQGKNFCDIGIAAIPSSR